MDLTAAAGASVAEAVREPLPFVAANTTKAKAASVNATARTI